MAFALKNLTGLEVEIMLLGAKLAGKSPATLFAERLESSSLKQMKNLEVDIQTGMPLSIYHLGQRIPIAFLSKKNIQVSVSTKEISLTVGPQIELDSTSDKQKFITTKHLKDASNLLNSLLLEIGGFSGETKIRVTVVSKYSVVRKIPNFNHLVDSERLKATSKLGMGMELIEGVFKFKADELLDVADFEIHVELPAEESDNKNLNWTCTRIELTSLKSMSLGLIVKETAEMSRKAAAILGV